MNVNTNGFPQPQGGQQQFLNPAMLQSLQSQGQNPQFQKNNNNPALVNPQMFQQQGLVMNPQQLLNGRGASAMSQQLQLNQSLNPALLLQMQGGNTMQAGLGGGMGGVGQGALGMGGMGNAGIMGGVNANALGFTQQHLAQLQMTPQQQMQAKMLQQRALQQRQMGQMNQGQPQFDQRQQIQQQPMQPRFLQDQPQFNPGQQNGLQGVLAQQQSMHNTPNFFERPSSSSSATHSQPFSQQSPQGQQFSQQQNSQFQMMPPPPPRPPSSRPGTSHSQISHHSGPTVVAPSSPALGGAGHLAGMQRPPSRPRTSSGFNVFGQGPPIPPKPPTPVQSSLPHQPQPQAHTPTHATSPFLHQQLQLQSQQQQQQQSAQHQQPQVQTPQGFGQVPSTPVPGSPGRKRRLTGQGGLDAQFGGMTGAGMTGLGMNNAGNVGAGGLMSMPQSMGSPNPTLLGGAGGGLMGPPHVVPSRANSLGGQTPQLPQGLDDGSLFQQQLAGGQASLPPQVSQPPIPGGVGPFQTPSGVPNVGIGGGGMRQRQPGLGVPGFPDMQASLQSPMVQKGPQTVMTPAQMQMQMHGGDALTINTGVPEVQGLPVASDAAVSLPLPLSHPPTAPVSAAPSTATLPTHSTLPSASHSSAPASSKTMRVTLVSPADIKPLDEEEVTQVKGWMARDKEYESHHRGMKERMAEELRAYRAENRDLWWEVSDGKKMRTKFGVTYPGQRLRDNRKRGRREGFRLPAKVDPEEAKREETLVPIRVEFDVEHHRMREAFVWNLNDPVVTPELFAQSLVDDYALAPTYFSVIVKSIQDQLSDYQAHTTDVVPENESETLLQGQLDENEKAWWDKWRKELPSIAKRPKEALITGRKRRKVDVNVKVERNPNAPATVADIEIDEKEQQEEMRILIRLDIGIGSMKLDDQFEWDIENPGASPEQFAEVYARELGLGSEFRTAIAHSIREQVHTYQKSLFLVGHPSDGTAVQDDDLRMSFLSPVTSVARPMDQVQAFTPILNYLSDSEMERNEKEREKEMNKRKKRNTRGRRGVALPDREPIKTLRTPAIGFPDVDPAVLALAQAAAAPTSRRAAAAAASLTIANMVASENGTAVITPTLPMATPTVAIPSAPKEKKTKGLFRAPPYPPTVLHPRAQVTAPTMSTAADASKLPPPLENDPPAPMPVPPPQDNRLPRVISAKRAKELEREAKEKEFADGQHPNLINGIWHCSNCGCPEDIAIGRRKGPLGDKSQCGLCGKFWHRHRRPRPVVYNPDPEYHLGLRTETDKSKIYPKKKGGAAARATNTPAVDQDEPTPAPAPEPETPSKAEPVVEIPRRAQSGAGRRHVDTERAVSPVSSGSSSASESPLIQKMKLNGTGHSKSDSNTPMPPPTTDDMSPPHPGPSDRPTSPVQTTVGPPESLIDAHAAMNAKYPDDRFEIAMRTAASGEQEWRVRCLDCPGKLYIPGDGMSNFEVHLKNRNHRARVSERVGTARTRSSHDQR
ncbi:hypothetical protein EDB86DRAFT_3211773 [Lactarius hatsudake]|nr:hypothetical protein EDB86DRAFT_3211773 [Lactarius hatsudake]